MDSYFGQKHHGFVSYKHSVFQDVSVTVHGFPVPSSPCLVCVRVRMCLWVCVIEADSLQLRVITVGLYLFLSRSHLCQILAVFAVVVYGPFWFRDSWALLLPGLRSPDLWLPIASLRYPRLPYGELRFCLRKAPPLSTKSSTLVSRCVLLLVINSLFRNWILPSSLWQLVDGLDWSGVWITCRLL